jgi:hypothetical protein
VEARVYRGYTPPDWGQFVDYIDHVGEPITWWGFLSSAKTPEKAFMGNVFFTIRSHHGRELGDYADKPAEDEVTFPAETQFLVVALEPVEGMLLVELEELA